MHLRSKPLVFAFLLPFAAFGAAPVANWAPNITLASEWQGNATNGEAVWDRIGTMRLGADIVASSAYQASNENTFHATAHFSGDWFPRYRLLDDGQAGARFDWRHAFGTRSNAPTFAIETAGDGVAAVESARRGMRGALTATLATRLAATWRVALRQQYDMYSASSRVFDGHGATSELEVSHDLDESTRITLAGIWRNGDVVTYAQYGRPDLVAIAHHYEPLSTFGRPMIAYSATARTAGGRLAWIRAMTEQAAWEFTYTYAATRRTGLRFENQTFALSLIRQF